MRCKRIPGAEYRPIKLPFTNGESFAISAKPNKDRNTLMLQYYRIADLTVAMDVSGRTQKQAEAYITEKTENPDVTILSDPEAIQNAYPNASLDEGEHAYTCSQFYGKLLEFDGMLLHASAVVKDGFAFLFSANSGTGKSTHTTLWRKVYGYDRVRMLNDDKPALRRENGRWYAYGTPWSGKTNQNLNLKVPLGGICILERGEKNEIAPLDGAKAAFELLQQTARPPMPEARGKLLEYLNYLLESVPVWKLRCNMDDEAAKVSHNAMYQAAKEKWPEE